MQPRTRRDKVHYVCGKYIDIHRLTKADDLTIEHGTPTYIYMFTVRYATGILRPTNDRTNDHTNTAANGSHVDNSNLYIDYAKRIIIYQRIYRHCRRMDGQLAMIIYDN